MPLVHHTTVLCVRRDGVVALGGDGQVSVGPTIVKSTANKVRRLKNDRILAGFAGSAADGIALLERFEGCLSAHSGNMYRAAVELAKSWRLDKALRRLEALLIVADREHQLLLSGAGDVIEADDGVLAVGSGGNYALAAARALLRHTDLDAEAVVRTALGLAAEICVYTNTHLRVEVLGKET